MACSLTSALRPIFATTVAVAALAPAATARAQQLPFNIGAAVRATEQAQEAAPQVRPSQPLVLPQLAEPQFTFDDR